MFNRIHSFHILIILAIIFLADQAGIARITVFNPIGQIVKLEEKEIAGAGNQSFAFSGKDRPAGVYFYTIEFPENQRVIVSRKMLLVK